MSLTKYKAFIIFMVIGILVFDCEARKRKKNSMTRAEKKRLEKMQILQKRETNAVNFSRLIVMRLIYGVASWMGVQERLSGIMNGVFIPPGAEDDDYAFDLDDDDDGPDFGDFFDGS